MNPFSRGWPEELISGINQLIDAVAELQASMEAVHSGIQNAHFSFVSRLGTVAEGLGALSERLESIEDNLLELSGRQHHEIQAADLLYRMKLSTAKWEDEETFLSDPVGCYDDTSSLLEEILREFTDAESFRGIHEKELYDAYLPAIKALLEQSKEDLLVQEAIEKRKRPKRTATPTPETETEQATRPSRPKPFEPRAGTYKGQRVVISGEVGDKYRIVPEGQPGAQREWVKKDSVTIAPKE